MIDLIAGLIILVGAVFSLIAGIGLYRLPDIFVRMHAATKAGTLGAGLVLLAIAVDSQDIGVVTRAIAGLVFLLLTLFFIWHFGLKDRVMKKKKKAPAEEAKAEAASD